MNQVVLADADNTLWDTDSVFADAQRELLTSIEYRFGTPPQDDPIAFVRQYDQALAQGDHRQLRYPPAQLVRALGLGIRGIAPREAAQIVSRAGDRSPWARSELDALVRAYTGALEELPQLLPGVLNGLQSAKRAGADVWILTEGAADRQRDRAHALGLGPLINGITEAAKTPEQFGRQQRRFAPARVFVVGDQPDRDIAPARAAGCVGVLVPSRFRPLWHGDSAWNDADFVADRFDVAMAWILSRNPGLAWSGCTSGELEM